MESLLRKSQEHLMVCIVIQLCVMPIYCNNGTQSADQFCPEGLLFNGETCDYSHNVDCEAECEYGKGI